MTNRQRIFDLLAAQPDKAFTKDEIVAALKASSASVGDALCWLRLSKRISRHHDHDHPKPGPHYRYRIVKAATRPRDGRRRSSNTQHNNDQVQHFDHVSVKDP